MLYLALQSLLMYCCTDKPNELLCLLLISFARRLSHRAMVFTHVMYLRGYQCSLFYLVWAQNSSSCSTNPKGSEVRALLFFSTWINNWPIYITFSCTRNVKLQSGKKELVWIMIHIRALDSFSGRWNEGRVALLSVLQALEQMNMSIHISGLSTMIVWTMSTSLWCDSKVIPFYKPYK